MQRWRGGTCTQFARKFASAAALLALVAALGIAANPGGTADHVDAPLARADLALDIGDIYAEQAPDNADETLIVVTASPVQVPGESRPWATRREGLYRVNIDRNGDATRDARITVRFGDVRDDGTQRVRVRLNGRTIGSGFTGDTIKLRGGGRAMVDVFDDPFFIDFQAVLDDLEGMGGPRRFCDGHEVDFLAGLNIGAIVIQLPTETLMGPGRNSEVGLWAETFDRRLGKVIDRQGQPEVPTFFIEDDEPGLVTGLGTRDKYNLALPQDDVANFGDAVAEKLIEFSSRDDTPYTDDQAVELVTTDILPDVLRFDPSADGGIFEGNGRRILDDALDFALSRATGGAFGGTAADPTDCIDANDADVSTTFPYLAPAHQPTETGSAG